MEAIIKDIVIDTNYLYSISTGYWYSSTRVLAVTYQSTGNLAFTYQSTGNVAFTYQSSGIQVPMYWRSSEILNHSRISQIF
jgi:hypothetical protein